MNKSTINRLLFFYSRLRMKEIMATTRPVCLSCPRWPRSKRVVWRVSCARSRCSSSIVTPWSMARSSWAPNDMPRAALRWVMTVTAVPENHLADGGAEYQWINDYCVGLWFKWTNRIEWMSGFRYSLSLCDFEEIINDPFRFARSPPLLCIVFYAYHMDNTVPSRHGGPDFHISIIINRAAWNGTTIIIIVSFVVHITISSIGKVAH